MARRARTSSLPETPATAPVYGLEYFQQDARAPLTLQSTDLVATVPQRFAERVEIAINLFWHARYHRDPASLWLRQLLVELFADPVLGG